jgi:hypothetical protein
VEALCDIVHRYSGNSGVRTLSCGERFRAIPVGVGLMLGREALLKGP